MVSFCKPSTLDALKRSADILRSITYIFCTPIYVNSSIFTGVNVLYFTLYIRNHL